MKIIVKKTKIMCISCQKRTKRKILIDGQQVEEVDKFKYLGSVVTTDGYCEKDVPRRSSVGKKAFVDKKKLFSNGLNLDL